MGYKHHITHVLYRYSWEYVRFYVASFSPCVALCSVVAIAVAQEKKTLHV